MIDKQTVKVGDRITAKLDDAFKDYRAGDTFYVQEIEEHAGETVVVFTDNVGDTRRRRVSEFTVEHVPAADATGKPAFTIEVGKFYRSRDGRKFGPIDHNGFGIYGAPELPGYWYENGLSYSDNTHSLTDLIAEWINEPASNDNSPLTKPAIVALIEDGQPKPSEQPKVHKSEESATDEAERLAVKYPGQKFGVFVLADSRIADVVIRRAA